MGVGIAVAWSQWLWLDLAHRLGLTLLHSLWQAAAIALLAVTVIGLLRLPRGRARHTVFMTAIVLAALAAAATFLLIQPSVNRWTPTIAPRVPDEARLLQLMADGPSEPFVLGLVPPPHQAPPIDPATTQLHPGRAWTLLLDGIRTALPWLIVCWLVLVVALAARMVVGMAAAARLGGRRRALPPSWGERLTPLLEAAPARPRVLTAERLDQPVAMGFFRPTILLPADLLDAAEPAMIDAVVAHELAHLRRRDLWTNLLQAVVEALLCLSPALWWLSRRARVEREICCDQAAVAVTGDRLAYARALELVAQRARTVPVPQTAFARSRHAVLERIKIVLGLHSPRARMAWPAALVVFLLLLILMPAAARQAAEQQRRLSLIRSQPGDVWQSGYDLETKAANRGYAAYSAGRYDKALSNFNAAVRMGPLRGNNYRWRAHAWSRLGRPDEERADLLRAVLAHTADIARQPYVGFHYTHRSYALRALGLDEHADADVRRAIAIMTIVIDQAPDVDFHSGLIRARAWAYETLGDQERAMADMRRVSELRSHLPTTHTNLGAMAARFELYDEAVAAYRRAVNFPGWSGDVGFRLELARILVRAGDKPAAMTELDLIIALDPNNPAAHDQRAILLLEAGHHEQALEAGNRAIRLSRTDGSFFRNRARTLQKLCRYTEALNDMDEAIRLWPAAALYWYERAGLRHKHLNDLHGALTDCDQAIALAPQWWQYHQRRGVVRAKLGQIDGAIADLSRAIDMHPQGPWAWYYRADLLSNHDAAIADLRQAVALDRSDPPRREFHLRLIRRLREAERPDDARQAIEAWTNLDAHAADVWADIQASIASAHAADDPEAPDDIDGLLRSYAWACK